MTLIIQFTEFLFKSLEKVVGLGFEGLERVIAGLPEKPKEKHDAKFIPAHTLLSSSNKGFYLGQGNITVKNSYMNALVAGFSGSGKSSTVLIPSIYTMTGSFVIHDPAGELYTATVGHLVTRGYKVKVLNFAIPGVSCGYNILKRADTPSNIRKVATMIVQNSLGSKSSDPFWSNSGTGVIAMMIAILKTQPEEYQNMYSVYRLVNMMGSHPERVDKLFSDFADEGLFSEYKGFLNYDEKLQSSIIATCRASLQIFSDPSVAMVGSVDTLAFEEFRTEKVALFIQNSIADQAYYATMTSLLFEQLFAFLMGKLPNDTDNDVFLLLDECSSLTLPTLNMATANLRKHRCGAMILVQDFNQLVHSYGKPVAEAIRSNCFSKMYFSGMNIGEAEMLERTLGKFEYIDKEERKHIRSLQTADELRLMKGALLLCGSHKPIKVKLRPYYEDPKMKRYSRIPSPAPVSDIPPGDIPQLPLEADYD